MNNSIVFISMIITVLYHVLKMWILDKEEVELTEQGRKIRFWGSLILAAIFLIVFVILSVKSMSLINKWFVMLVVIVALGFHAFVEWKYRKGSKLYTIDLILLIVGIGLVYLFYFYW